MAIPLGLAAFACAIAALLRPDLWSGYIGMLTDAAGIPLIIPLAWRLPVAIAIVVWGARTNGRWTVPVGAAIALPQSWWTNFALLTAIPRTLDQPLMPMIARFLSRIGRVRKHEREGAADVAP